jgi:asparagine synthase (glutamine-hydrolysing)
VTGDPFQPTPLEIATGRLLGAEEAPALPELPAGTTPLDALRSAVIPALLRPPCFVTFSGGRDSSAVLATAVDVARREGLAPPVPVTVRFRDTPGAGEPEWQELVVRHLGLDDWLVLEVGDELDVVGPVATGVLRRHGVRYPAHTCLWAYLIEQASGGSLLTGIGGDHVFAAPLAFVREALAWRRRPRLRDLRVIAFAAAPRPLRRAVLRHRAGGPPWLRPAAQRAFATAWAESIVRTPTSFRGHLAGVMRPRTMLGMLSTLELLGGDADAAVVHPLIDAGFLAALARAGGPFGFGGRTAAMHAVFSRDLLPEALLSRERKALFDLAYLRQPTRELARSFDGAGLDPELVDSDRLRAEWLSPVPSFASALALQAAWLASAARDREQPVERRG